MIRQSRHPHITLTRHALYTPPHETSQHDTALAQEYPLALVYLIGATILGDNLAGHVIMFLGGIASALMPVLHWKLYAVADKGALGYWFAAIVLSMGVTGAFGAVLAVLVMWQTWKQRRAGSPPR